MSEYEFVNIPLGVHQFAERMGYGPTDFNYHGIVAMARALYGFEMEERFSNLPGSTAMAKYGGLHEPNADVWADGNLLSRNFQGLQGYHHCLRSDWLPDSELDKAWNPPPDISLRDLGFDV